MSALTYRLYFVFQDGSTPKPKRSTTYVDVDPSLPLASLPSAIEAVGLLFDPVTGGAIVAAGATIEIDTVAAGFQGIPQALSDIEEGARFAFRTVNGFIKRFRLPTFLESLFGDSGSSDNVDLADTDVLALTAALTNGIVVDTDVDVIFVDSRGEGLELLEYAVEDFNP